MNGVNVENLVAAVGAIKENPSAGDYSFFSETIWKDGAVSASTIQRYVHNDDGPATKKDFFELSNDEPEQLMGTNTAANPVETVIAGLAGCLAIGISYSAAARGIHLEELKISIEGKLNLQGFLGIDQNVRAGYDQILLEYHIKTDASDDKVKELIEYVESTSPVLDIVKNPVPVETRINIG